MLDKNVNLKEKMFILKGSDEKLAADLFDKARELFNSYPKHVGMGVLNDMFFNVIFKLNLTKEQFLQSMSEQWDFEKKQSKGVEFIE